MSEAKYMVEDIIGFIKNPEKYSALGARMPKDYFSMALLAQEDFNGQSNCWRSGRSFYAMSGSDFVQMYVGVGSSRIRSLFNKAKKNESCNFYR